MSGATTAAAPATAAQQAVFNKADILENVGQWSILDGPDTLSFKSSDEMEDWLSGELENFCDFLIFSGDPHKI